MDLNMTDFTKQELEIINKRGREKFIDIIRNHEDSKLWNRTDLEGWKVLSDSGIIHRRYGEIDVYFLYVEEMEQQGGECDICGIAWKKNETIILKDTKNELRLINYQPGCKCYPRCVWCGRWLILERKNKMGGCYYCGPNGIKCWRLKPGMKQDENGDVKPTGKMQKCKGRLRLQSAKDGYTVMKCDVCGFEWKKEILI